MKLICKNSNSSHINANGVRSDAAGTIGQLDTLLPLCTLDVNHVRIISGRHNVPQTDRQTCTAYVRVT